MQFIPNKKIGKLSEAMIQAELYHACKNNQINCYLEYEYGGLKFDAIIYDDNNNVYAIIEIKSCEDGKNKSFGNCNGRQSQKYRKFNIPIIVINHKTDIWWAIDKIKCLLVRKRKENIREEKRIGFAKILPEFYHNFDTSQSIYGR